jgi:hypothetical protein
LEAQPFLGLIFVSSSKSLINRNCTIVFVAVTVFFSPRDVQLQPLGKDTKTGISKISLSVIDSLEKGGNLDDKSPVSIPGVSDRV